MNPIKLQIIISSVRQNRFGDKPAAWIAALAKEAGTMEVEMLDLKDHMLPDYTEAGSPAALKGKFTNQDALRWNETLAKGDAYIIVTPEYNHGYPGSLKNALDWTYTVLNNKPVAFVSYGTMGGARAVEQLRGVAAELQMADIRHAVHMSRHWELQDESGNLKPETLDVYVDGAKAMLEQLLWWARALKAAREQKQ